MESLDKRRVEERGREGAKGAREEGRFDGPFGCYFVLVSFVQEYLLAPLFGAKHPRNPQTRGCSGFGSHCSEHADPKHIQCHPLTCNTFFHWGSSSGCSFRRRFELLWSTGSNTHLNGGRDSSKGILKSEISGSLLGRLMNSNEF